MGVTMRVRVGVARPEVGVSVAPGLVSDFGVVSDVVQATNSIAARAVTRDQCAIGAILKMVGQSE